MKIFLTFACCLLFCFAAIQAGPSRKPRSLTISDESGAVTYYDVLRGRDGMPGVKGEKGESGERGMVGPRGPPGPASGGVMFTRWGKSSCPNTPGTELLYTGRTAGTWYSQEGGGANYLCMPEDPEYDSTLTYRGGVNDHARIHGTEYQGPVQGTVNHNVPCAVCLVSTREVVVMIPAKASCPPSWTREYYGYLMTEYRGRSGNVRGRTMFECVDRDQESIPGSSANTDGATFHHVEATCNGLPCPPYNEHQELNCVVCTR